MPELADSEIVAERYLLKLRYVRAGEFEVFFLALDGHDRFVIMGRNFFITHAMVFAVGKEGFRMFTAATRSELVKILDRLERNGRVPESNSVEPDDVLLGLIIDILSDMDVLDSEKYQQLTATICLLMVSK